MKKYLSRAFIAALAIFVFLVLIVPSLQKMFILPLISPRKTEPVQTKTQTKKETSFIAVGILMDVKMIPVICIDEVKQFKYYLTLREINKEGKIIITQYFTDMYISVETVGKTIAVEPLNHSALCDKK